MSARGPAAAALAAALLGGCGAPGSEMPLEPAGSASGAREDDGRGARGVAWTMEDAATAVALSPDGALVAAGDASGTVACRDAATGAPLWTARVHAGQIAALAFDPSGRRLSVAGTGVALEVRDAAGGAVAWSLPGDTREEISRARVAFSGDGGFLLAAGFANGSMRAFRAEDGTPSGETPGVGTDLRPGEGDAVVAATTMGEVLLLGPAPEGGALVVRTRAASGIDPLAAGLARTGISCVAPTSGGFLAGTEGGTFLLLVPGRGAYTLFPANAPAIAVGDSGGGAVALALADGSILSGRWGVEGPGSPRMPAVTLREAAAPSGGLVQAAAFDGALRRVALGGRDGTVRVLDIAAAVR
jgi:outer membrane protein assembly factor BamB